MSTLSDKFNKKVELLKQTLFGGAGADRSKDLSSVCGRYAAFISVSDINEQAYVFRASERSPEEAWEKALSNALEFIGSENVDPAWVKADITYKGEKKQLSEVLEGLSKGYPKFFRKGISFDEELDTAIIEAELNVNALIDYDEGRIELTELNRYLAANDMKTLSQFPEDVILFTCTSAFCDEKGEVYEL